MQNLGILGANGDGGKNS